MGPQLCEDSFSQPLLKSNASALTDVILSCYPFHTYHRVGGVREVLRAASWCGYVCAPHTLAILAICPAGHIYESRAEEKPNPHVSKPMSRGDRRPRCR